MSKLTDIRPIGAALDLLPVQTRVPLKFGPETLTHVTCARVRVTVRDRSGRTACGWGETPLSVQWVWPGNLPYEQRHEALREFCRLPARAWADFDDSGYPLEVGHHFQRQRLGGLIDELNRCRMAGGPMPRPAGLVCGSPFAIALHDAYGRLHGAGVYDTTTRTT